MPVQTVIKLRRDTAANWESTNPVLASGEEGYETDTGFRKIGNGTSAWASLPYMATSRIAQTVKNTSGSPMAKGSVVYISSATGGDVSVSLADADTEATSSKTIGLLGEAVANDGFGEVVTEGLLSGVNTASATAGQSVWLSSTAGGFVFNAPPAKPAHSVYLGVVTRVHATEGEILVKVQNGYELEELHNVNITSPQNNDIIVYNSVSGMWVNTPAQSGWVSIAVSTNTTLEKDTNYFVNTSAGSVTLTLPASPSQGDELHVFDETGNASINNIIVTSASEKIAGVAQNLEIDVDYAAVVIVYVSTTYGWRIN